MAAVRRLGAQILPSQKEKENTLGKAFGKVVRPRAALGDIGNKALNDQKLAGDVKKTLARSKASSLLPTTTKLSKDDKIESIDMQDVGEALADCLIPGEVDDIDREDFNNPQLCAEYVNEIMRYLRAMERKYSVSPDYMNGQNEVNEKMRTILVDWLIQVHSRFHLLQETLYLTVSILDRFLANYQVSKQKLQLVGVSAMLLASKYEEMYAPVIEDFVYITDNAYTTRQIRQMEALIFKKLEFSLGKPLCLHFLRRNSKAGGVDAQKHTMAKYLMELTLADYASVKFLPSEIAAAALCLSMKLLDKSEWTKTLEYYSAYTERQLTPCLRRIAQLLIKTADKDSKGKAVYTKYSESKFMKISKLPCLRSSLLLEIVD